MKEETNESKQPPAPPAKRTVWVVSVLLVLALVGLWWFPKLWFTKSDYDGPPMWLTPRHDVPGWSFRAEEVAKSAENVLKADALFSGSYRNKDGGAVVRAFSAKRYTENERDIGLFVHTPDRCWTQGGWMVEVVEPNHAEVTIHGMTLTFERRIFVAGGHRELVYFGGLVGGRPLPYRLDHNYSVALKYQVGKEEGGADTRGAGDRAGDSLFWKRIWDGFAKRQPLLGPKQFIRVSTGIGPGGLEAADKRLVEFLPKWLETVDFEKELKEWEEKS
jgi:hypothetical protein